MIAGRRTVAYYVNFPNSSIYVLITEGRPLDPWRPGAIICGVYISDTRVDGHDRVVANILSALVSLGAKQYRPPVG